LDLSWLRLHCWLISFIKSSHVKLKSCQCCEFIAGFIEPYLVSLTLGLHANWG
jgi:hypothetical protein